MISILLLASALSVSLLGPSCIVVKRRKINLASELKYYYLKQNGCRELAKPVPAINKSFTPPEQKTKELKLVEAWNEAKDEFIEILQLNLYLLQEKDVLGGWVQTKRLH